MKKKALLTICLMIMACASFFACKGNVEEVATLTLDKPAVTMNVFEETTLIATYSKGEKPVSWTVADSEIVTVSDGVITAYKAGKTTVIASCEGLSASCEVTVNRGDKMLDIIDVDNELDVVFGGEETLSAKAALNGKEFTLATISYHSSGDVISVSEKGVITALKTGSQSVTIKATLYGAIVAEKKITVTVKEVGIIETGLKGNAVELKLSEELSGSKTSYTLDGVKASVNFEEVKNPEFSYASDDENVATFVNGVITAVGAGQTKVTISFVSEKGVKYDAIITVIVNKEIIKKDINFFVKGDAGRFAENTGTAEVDLTGKNIDLSKLENVTCGDNAITFAVDGDSLKLVDAPAGERTYLLSLSDRLYIIEGCVYNSEIKNKEELIAYAAEMGGICGYTVITSDIDFEGAEYAATGSWQHGVLDGRGHTISNAILTTSIIGSQNEAGVLKNIQFIDCVFDATNLEAAKFGIFGHELTGRFEDIYVKASVIGAVNDGNLLIGALFDSTVVKNVIADITVNEDVTVYGMGKSYNQGTPTIENVYIVCNRTVSDVVFGGSKKNVSASYPSVSDLLSAQKFETFTEWNAEEGNVPYLSEYNGEPVYIVEGAMQQGGFLTVAVTDVKASFHLKNEVGGVTVFGRKIIIGEEVALGTEIIVVIESENLAENKEFAFKLLGTENLSYSDEYAEIKEGELVLELDKLSKTVNGAAIEKVFVNDGTCAFTAEDGKLKIITDKAGALTVKLLDSANYYIIELLAADKIISTAEDVESYFRENRMTAKYAVLANDIDMSEKGRIDNYTQNFSGVFDGREHTISNMKTGFGLVFKMTGGTIKNVTFTNYGYAGGAENGYNSGIIGGIWGDNYTLDNVHFKAYQMSAPSVASGLIARDHCAEAATVIKNSTFDITCYAGSEEVPVMLFHDSNYRSTTMENVTVNYTGTLVKFGETGTGYGGEEEMTFGEKVTHTNVTLIDKRDYVVITYSEKYIVLKNGKAELDASKFSEIPGEITEIKLNGTVCAFVKDEQKITISNVVAGNAVFVVKTADNKIFLFSLTIADKVISTAEEFVDYWREDGMTAKYTVLVNDVDLSEKGTISNWTLNFSNVFDGLNNKITGMRTRHGLIYKMTGGTIKNVTFDDYYYEGQDGAGVVGNIWADGYTLENVHFKATQTGAPVTASGLIAKNHSAEPIIIKDCTFDITCYAGSEEVPVMLFHDSNYIATTMENVTVNYTGTLVKFGETGTGYDGAGEKVFGEKVTRTNVTLTDKRDAK